MVISIDSIASIGQEATPASPGDASFSERRRERRYALDASCGTAAIMGSPDSRMLCKIVDVSRTGMRIRLNTPFAVGSQVHVQWGEHFFVGDCCYRLQKGDGYVLGLRLVASNCVNLPGKLSFALGRLVAFCRARVRDRLNA
jgi:hypothetical protein